jgi:uncharacterized damage-inducible protein DinB
VSSLVPHLQRGFDYDLWANRRWLEWIDALPDPAHARTIMEHIGRAQHIWLSRFGRAEGDFLAENLSGTLARQCEIWKATVAELPLNDIYHWKRLDGLDKQGTLEDVARHVINHGTYHRGHLRGLADAAGFEGFEDTDFARYFDQF